MKNLTIIFTGGTNGLSKEIKKILLQKKFEILNFNKKNYDLSKLSSQKKIQDKIRQLKKKKNYIHKYCKYAWRNKKYWKIRRKKNCKFNKYQFNKSNNFIKFYTEI